MIIDTEQKLNIELEEAIRAGVIYGHKRSRTNPRMRNYIVANRNEIEILNAEETLQSLKKAIDFLEGLFRQGGLILAVSVKPAAREAIDRLNQELGFPKVSNRWLGGTLTNFPVIRKRLEYYLNLKKLKKEGEFEKYTKKEQLLFDREIEKLSVNFDGLINLDRLPDCVFIVDPFEHQTAVKEARHCKLPIVAIIDSDDNPDLIDYPIIANDHAKSSIDWLVGKIIERLKLVKPTIGGNIINNNNDSGNN
jgi:small subunit ribosomal protein S2